MGVGKSIEHILAKYGISSELSIERIGTGHINKTFRVGEEFILQQVNTHVFKDPWIIANNVRAASLHLKKVAPDYLFVSTIKNLEGLNLTVEGEEVWRLFPFIKDAVTINEVQKPEQAYAAAKAFGELSKLLNNCDTTQFQESIPRFHDLSLRFSQFEEALGQAELSRKKSSERVCSGFLNYRTLVKRYVELVESGSLQLRIVHNDTKINNVLFSAGKNEVVCVVDLDTLMPGFFVYDLGDMVRTMASPVSEEESDLEKISVREDFLQAIHEGYLSEMKAVLTKEELASIQLAGPLMTYIIGLRFITDYLAGDRYFHINYPNQNLVRATNQLTLLEKLIG